MGLSGISLERSRCATQVRLQRDAGSGVFLLERGVQLERSIHIARVFHVEPERGSGFLRLGRENEQVALAFFEGEIETELRRLDAHLRRKSQRANLIEEPAGSDRAPRSRRRHS